MKILLMQPDLRSGGIERSLINMINILKHDHEIDLFLLSKSGEFYEQLDRQSINIVSCDNNFSREESKLKKYFRYLKMFLFRKNYLNKTRFLEDKQYDVAIVFHGANIELLNIIKNNVKAEKKLAFIHGTPSVIKKSILKYGFKAVDKFVCVSNSCQNSLINMFPDMVNRIKYLYNSQNIELINEKSNEFNITYNESKINILSVARFGKEKGHHRLLNVCEKLVSEGINNFKFHLVGDGPTKLKLENSVAEKKLDSYFEFYGNQNNPYPYFKNADLFIIMSYHEAAPMVIGECSIMHLPILSTKTISAEEMITRNGLVCENEDEDLYLAIKKIILNYEIFKTSMIYDKVFDEEMYKKEFEKLVKE